MAIRLMTQMRSVPIRLMVFSWVVIAMADLTRSQETQKTYKIPQDPTATVLLLDFSGGFRAPPPAGFKRTPFLRVFADGKVITGQNLPDQPEHTFKLTAEQFQALLNQIITVEDFLAIDSKKVSEAIAKSKNPIRIADAPNTEITLNLEDQTHHVAIYALSMVASQMKEIPEVTRLSRIENLLRNVHSIASAGGPDEVQKFVAFANQYLAQNHPDSKPITSENLRWCSTVKGKKQLTFTHSTATITVAEADTGLTVRYADQRRNE